MRPDVGIVAQVRAAVIPRQRRDRRNIRVGRKSGRSRNVIPHTKITETAMGVPVLMLPRGHCHNIP